MFIDVVGLLTTAEEDRQKIFPTKTSVDVDGISLITFLRLESLVSLFCLNLHNITTAFFSTHERGNQNGPLKQTND